MQGLGRYSRSYALKDADQQFSSIEKISVVDSLLPRSPGRKRKPALATVNRRHDSSSTLASGGSVPVRLVEPESLCRSLGLELPAPPPPPPSLR